MSRQNEYESKGQTPDLLRRKLEKETGLSIQVPETIDACEASLVLERLLSAFNHGNTAEEQLRKLLTEELLPDEQLSCMRHLGLPEEAVYAVFLIDLPRQRNGVDDFVIEALRDLFVQGQADRFADMGEGLLLFLRRLGRYGEGFRTGGRGENARRAADRESFSEISDVAESLMDVLSGELMTEAKIACSRAHFGTELPAAYAQAKKALDVGMMFPTGEQINYYDCLGMRRLIFDLPEESCRAYLEEIYDGEMPEHVDEELLVTARAFFENGMNISDTARKLFVHRNTLIYRLEKLYRATGLDIRRFEDAMTFRHVLLIYERLHYKGDQP